MNESEALVAAGYDRVYDATPRSPTLQRIWHEQAGGPDFPSEFGNISFLTLIELHRLATELRVSAGDLLVDLACGAGGPGLWAARETGARLVGVDISAAGIAAATALAAELGMADVSSFEMGSFAASGLDDRSAHAAMTVDALQYAPDKSATFAEIARVLKPGGRFVFTAFEVDPGRVAGVPVLGDDPVVDYSPGLEAAGLGVDAYDESADWWERMTGAYQAVLDATSTLTEELGSDAFASLAMEMTLTLQVKPYPRRVFAIATKR